MLFFELFPFFMTAVVVIVGVRLVAVNRRARHDPDEEALQRHATTVRQSVSTRAAENPEATSGSRRPSMNA